MRPLNAPFKILNTEFASHITALLDKDFDPFDSETSDIYASGEEGGICLYSAMFSGHKLEHDGESTGGIQ